MRSFVPAIYDITVAIPKSSAQPTMLRLFKGQSSVVRDSFFVAWIDFVNITCICSVDYVCQIYYLSLHQDMGFKCMLSLKVRSRGS